MDCLRSFNFNAQVSGYSISTTSIKTWTLGLQEYFVFDAPGTSVFNISGFKNINIFGCRVVGNVQADIQPTGGCVLEDWNILVRLNGQTPLISGSVDPLVNFWNLTTTGNEANTFELGRHTPDVKFNTPFQSVRTIEIVGIKGQGYGGQTIGNITLDIDLNFIFDYQYEGE
jgi:WD40 repeat protein